MQCYNENIEPIGWLKREEYIMKHNFMALIVFISIVVCGTSITNAQKKSISNTSIMEVNVKGANVKIKKGRSDKIETEYYGTASDSNYILTAAKNGDTYKIILNYIGKGMAPAINEGGVVVKVPDNVFSILRIKGRRGAGIVLNKINADTDLVTKDCAVVINNRNSSNKINIDSTADAYEINSVPMSEDFHMKASGSVVEYTFTKQPSNLIFKLTGGYAELPPGLGRPKMIVKLDNGIFELSVND